MNKKEQIVAEVRRVHSKLGTVNITQNNFQQNSKISVSTVKRVFGSWNRAIEAAGIEPIKNFVPSVQEIQEEELLSEIVRLTKEIGKPPSENEMSAMGKFSDKPYRRRWGSFTRARELAYQKYGFPSVEKEGKKTSAKAVRTPLRSPFFPTTIKPGASRRQKKAQFGEPIDFRGLRFAPINEQSVVYLFGMISRELGFLIESIRTEYPDCEGKRRVDEKENRWEHVKIEFEYKSSHFAQHGHSPEDCDVIVCWIHDWPECPIEVVELKSIIKHLPT